MLVECFVHLFKPSTERGCVTQFRTIQKKQTVDKHIGAKDAQLHMFFRSAGKSRGVQREYRGMGNF